jgi:hypothetical protein
MYIFGERSSSSETFLRQDSEAQPNDVRYVVQLFRPRKLGQSTSVWDRQVYD